MEKNKKGTKNKNLRKERGITLIALVVTVILLLILATITITGAINGGLFEHAENAKNSAEISNEKEIVQEAFTWAYGKSNTGTVTVSELQKYIPTEADTTVIDNGDTLVVKFNKKDRYYEVENSGNVEGPKEFLNDKYAGDLSKGGKYDGKTDETAFRITCIEDLVEFSKNYNKYNKGYIKLERTLDFKSIFSYNDYTSKAYGDLNGDGDGDDIRTELTKQGEKSAGFPTIRELAKEGTFDGQNNKICNLYQNAVENHTGLFYMNYGTIKNLGLKNIIIKEKGEKGELWGYVGGLASYLLNTSKVENCYVEGEITIKTTSVAGVGVLAGRSDGVLENCYTVGTLELDMSTGRETVGGIIGLVNGKIFRCYNIMDIKCNAIQIGGITAKMANEAEIEECFHIGNITGGDNTLWTSGLIGEKGSGTIKNCYNIGNINGPKNASGIEGGYSKTGHFNCYSVGEMTGTNSRGAITGMCYGSHILHCFARRGDLGELPETLDITQIKKYMSSYIAPWQNGDKGAKAQIGTDCNIFTDEEMKTQNFVDELNILEVADDEGVITKTEQSVWKMDEDGINGGYPIFTWQTKGKTKK